MTASDTAADLAKKKYESDQKNFETNTKLAEQRISKTNVPKDQQDKIVKTDKQTYNMSPADYSYARGLAIGNAQVQANHPEWFTTTQGKRGKLITKLNPDVKDDDLVRAYKETQEAPANVPVQQATPGIAVPTISPMSAPAPASDNKYNFAKQVKTAGPGIY
jgi:hypothetical protein